MSSLLETKLTNIANSIRNKTNTTRKMKVDEMPTLIESIKDAYKPTSINFYQTSKSTQELFAECESVDFSECTDLRLFMSSTEVNNNLTDFYFNEDIFNFPTNRAINLDQAFFQTPLRVLNSAFFGSLNNCLINGELTGTFRSNQYLTTANLSSLNLVGSCSLNEVFYNCPNLTSITLPQGINPRNISNAFNNCTSLTSLDLSNIDLSNLEEANQPFGNSFNLAHLDLRTFIPKPNYNYWDMFSNMNESCEIIVKNMWVKNYILNLNPNLTNIVPLSDDDTEQTRYNIYTPEYGMTLTIDSYTGNIQGYNGRDFILRGIVSINNINDNYTYTISLNNENYQLVDNNDYDYPIYDDNSQIVKCVVMPLNYVNSLEDISVLDGDEVGVTITVRDENGDVVETKTGRLLETLKFYINYSDNTSQSFIDLNNIDTSRWCYWFGFNSQILDYITINNYRLNSTLFTVNEVMDTSENTINYYLYPTNNVTMGSYSIETILNITYRGFTFDIYFGEPNINVDDVTAYVVPTEYLYNDTFNIDEGLYGKILTFKIPMGSNEGWYDGYSSYNDIRGVFENDNLINTHYQNIYTQEEDGNYYVYIEVQLTANGNLPVGTLNKLFHFKFDYYDNVTYEYRYYDLKWKFPFNVIGFVPRVKTYSDLTYQDYSVTDIKAVETIDGATRFNLVIENGNDYIDYKTVHIKMYSDEEKMNLVNEWILGITNLISPEASFILNDCDTSILFNELTDYIDIELQDNVYLLNAEMSSEPETSYTDDNTGIIFTVGQPYTVEADHFVNILAVNNSNNTYNIYRTTVIGVMDDGTKITLIDNMDNNNRQSGENWSIDGVPTGEGDYTSYIIRFWGREITPTQYLSEIYLKNSPGYSEVDANNIEFTLGIPYEDDGTQVIGLNVFNRNSEYNVALTGMEVYSVDGEGNTDLIYGNSISQVIEYNGQTGATIAYSDNFQGYNIKLTGSMVSPEPQVPTFYEGALTPFSEDRDYVLPDKDLTLHLNNIETDADTGKTYIPLTFYNTGSGNLVFPEVAIAAYHDDGSSSQGLYDTTFLNITVDQSLPTTIRLYYSNIDITSYIYINIKGSRVETPFYNGEVQFNPNSTIDVSGKSLSFTQGTLDTSGPVACMEFSISNTDSRTILNTTNIVIQKCNASGVVGEATVYNSPTQIDTLPLTLTLYGDDLVSNTNYFDVNIYGNRTEKVIEPLDNISLQFIDGKEVVSQNQIKYTLGINNSMLNVNIANLKPNCDLTIDKIIISEVYASEEETLLNTTDVYIPTGGDRSWQLLSLDPGNVTTIQVQIFGSQNISKYNRSVTLELTDIDSGEFVNNVDNVGVLARNMDKEAGSIEFEFSNSTGNQDPPRYLGYTIRDPEIRLTFFDINGEELGSIDVDNEPYEWSNGHHFNYNYGPQELVDLNNLDAITVTYKYYMDKNIWVPTPADPYIDNNGALHIQMLNADSSMINGNLKDGFMQNYLTYTLDNIDPENINVLLGLTLNSSQSGYNADRNCFTRNCTRITGKFISDSLDPNQDIEFTVKDSSDIVYFGGGDSQHFEVSLAGDSVDDYTVGYSIVEFTLEDFKLGLPGFVTKANFTENEFINRYIYLSDIDTESNEITYEAKSRSRLYFKHQVTGNTYIGFYTNYESAEPVYITNLVGDFNLYEPGQVKGPYTTKIDDSIDLSNMPYVLVSSSDYSYGNPRKRAFIANEVGSTATIGDNSGNTGLQIECISKENGTTTLRLTNTASNNKKYGFMSPLAAYKNNTTLGPQSDSECIFLRNSDNITETLYPLDSVNFEITTQEEPYIYFGVYVTDETDFIDEINSPMVDSLNFPDIVNIPNSIRLKFESVEETSSNIYTMNLSAWNVSKGYATNTKSFDLYLLDQSKNILRKYPITIPAQAAQVGDSDETLVKSTIQLTNLDLLDVRYYYISTCINGILYNYVEFTTALSGNTEGITIPLSDEYIGSTFRAGVLDYKLTYFNNKPNTYQEFGIEVSSYIFRDIRIEDNSVFRVNWVSNQEVIQTTSSNINNRNQLLINQNVFVNPKDPLGQYYPYYDSLKSLEESVDHIVIEYIEGTIEIS